MGFLLIHGNTEVVEGGSLGVTCALEDPATSVLDRVPGINEGFQ